MLVGQIPESLSVSLDIMEVCVPAKLARTRGPDAPAKL
jgi:hypothetical protein